MNDELEKSLRGALRPLDPGEKFTQGVLARVAADSRSAARRPAFVSRPVVRWTSATLALLCMAGLFTAHQWQAHRTRQGLEARRQLLEALQVTGENLDMAYRMINKPGA
jgi:hypothetical protein